MCQFKVRNWHNLIKQINESQSEKLSFIKIMAKYRHKKHRKKDNKSSHKPYNIAKPENAKSRAKKKRDRKRNAKTKAKTKANAITKVSDGINPQERSEA